MSQIVRLYNHISHDDLNFQLKIHASKSDNILEVNKAIYSFESIPTANFSIDFHLAYDITKLNPLLPEEERADFHKFVKFIIRYECKNSRRRGVYDLTKAKTLKDADEIFETTIDYSPNEWFGDIDFKCMLIRVAESNEHDQYLTEKYSILAESESKKLYLDPFKESSKGCQLGVRVGKFDFSDGDVEINALYQLKKDTPEIILNERAPKFILKALEHSYKKNGPNKNLQNALFAPIVVDVWEQLAREAFDEMMPSGSDDEPMDPRDLSFPFNKIAERIALALYDGSLEDAINNLKYKLSNQVTRRHLINRELPLAVQEIGNLQDDYEKVAEHYFKNI